MVEVFGKRRPAYARIRDYRNAVYRGTARRFGIRVESILAHDKLEFVIAFLDLRFLSDDLVDEFRFVV